MPVGLQKTEALQAEREQRGIHTPLVDCLQLSDKMQNNFQTTLILEYLSYPPSRTLQRRI
jgi:hypothetical protein